jgi:hypothetical protein
VKDFNLKSDCATLYINEQKVASNYTTHLREVFSAIQMHEYYANKYSWNDKTLKNILWEVHGLAMKKFGPDKQTSILKFIHGRTVCNNRENMYYPYCSPFCFSCKSEKEDICHILKCSGCEKSKLLRKKYISNLDDKLKTLQQRITKHSRFNSRCFHHTRIGWDHWFYGQICHKWGSLYQQDIDKTQNTVRFPSRNRWGKEIIYLTWMFMLEC